MNKTVMMAAMAGTVGVATAGGGGAYYLSNARPSAEELQVAAEIAERERFAREEELHYATVVSVMQRPDRRGAPMPVVVTFQLAGTRGFESFCANVPVVEEAVLRSLSGQGIDAPVRDAVNGVLRHGPVRVASVRPITDPNAGGAAAMDTQNKCKKALKG